MMLTAEGYQWASFTLDEQAAELRKQAVALRKRGASHLLIKPAAELVAAAYDRAAIELDRTRKGINQGCWHD
jgi:hypothetical protein